MIHHRTKGEGRGRDPALHICHVAMWLMIMLIMAVQVADGDYEGKVRLRGMVLPQAGACSQTCVCNGVAASQAWSM